MRLAEETVDVTNACYTPSRLPVVIVKAIGKILGGVVRCKTQCDSDRGVWSRLIWYGRGD